LWNEESKKESSEMYEALKAENESLLMENEKLRNENVELRSLYCNIPSTVILTKGSLESKQPTKLRLHKHLDNRNPLKSLRPLSPFSEQPPLQHLNSPTKVLLNLTMNLPLPMSLSLLRISLENLLWTVSYHVMKIRI